MPTTHTAEFESVGHIPTASSHKTGFAERWRKPASVVTVLTIVATLTIAPATSSMLLRALETYGGLALVVIAVLGRLWCAIYIAGRKNFELCVEGPYSIVRHPLYLFPSVGMLGVLLATHRPMVALLAFVMFWAYHAFVVREEEERLGRNFGRVFDEYRTRVPGAWPRLAAFNDVPSLVVTTRPLSRAFTEVVWFFAAWTLATLVSV